MANGQVPAVVLRSHVNAALSYLDFCIKEKVSGDEKERIQNFQEQDPAFKLMQNLDRAWAWLLTEKRNRKEEVTDADVEKFHAVWIGAVLEIEKTLPKEAGG